MARQKYKYLFGPVPSRRLGRSLGVDIIPLKTCTQNCIYCQLGKDAPQTLDRKEYAPVDAVLDELKDRLNKLHDELVERRSEMKERLDSTQEDELSFLHEREKIVHHLKKPVYDHYERTRKIRDGFGIAHVTGSACGYCYSKIPPQRLSEIKRMDDIILYEVCGCFLVYSPD